MVANTLLHQACVENDLATVKNLIEIHRYDLSEKDDKGNTSLNLAAASGSLKTLMYLIEERKCSPGCAGQWGRSPLHHACEKNGNLAMVKYLVEKHGCDPSGKDEKGNTPLHVAAFTGNLDILTYLIEERKCSPGCAGQWGRSPLHQACGKNGNLAMVKYLVEKHGCDPAGKDEQGNTPLNVAAFTGNLDILMYLIEERKCSPGCAGRWGRSPLHDACEKNGNLAMVKYLVEKHGCDPSGKDEQGNTPLIVAAYTGNLDILTYLIEERKCSPGCAGRWGRSPLHHACQKNGNLAMVMYLVEKHGCDPSGKDEQGNTPLHVAAYTGNLDILTYLIEERKCSPGCAGQWGRSWLHNACEKNGNLAMVKYLVEKHGCDPSGKDEQGNTPLNVAAFVGNLDILTYLIEERKCSPGCADRWGRSPLHHACQKNWNLATVKYLVEKHGCDPSGKDEQGNTPLNVAASEGNLDILTYLIEERKCSPGCAGQWGRSSLHNACEKNGNLAMVKYLVEKHGCDPSGKDEQGNTPLNVAAFAGNLDILTYLIEERKCSPGCAGQWGTSPLHHACEKNANLAMVKYLVEKHGCDPSGKDEQGNTPLNVAASEGNLDILTYLIEERKCSPGCAGQWGRSSLHNACQKNGNLATVKYLVEKHGCDPSGKDEQGNTPLNVAAFAGNLDILTYLIEERKCSPGCAGQWGRSPLHQACGKNGNLAMVKYLVEKHGCDPAGKDEQGNTPLIVAAFTGNLDILTYLIEERKCSPGCAGRWGRSPLHNACQKNGNLAMVMYLVEKHGCDPSGKDEQGNTPLHVAAFVGNLDILTYLIEERKCSPGCAGQWGRSPLHNACEKNGNLAMVKYLVEKHGCDPSGKDEQGNTPLNVAAFSGRLDILTYLIEERKCNPGCADHWGRSMLHNACAKNGNLAVVKYLVEKHGCDPSGKDEQGNTPLNVAAFSGRLDILTYLIEERKCNPGCADHWGRSMLHNACAKNGNLAVVKYLVNKYQCDLFIRDKYGQTPLDLATTWKNEHVIQYLSQIMGIVPNKVHFGLPAGSTTLRDERTRQWIPQTGDGVPLQWDHPAVKNHLGPMLPDWCTFQKWNGDIVFVNMETATTIQEDPRAAHQRYKDALKDGFVSAKLMKILIIGAAGVGKTHLLRLLLNEAPPEVRHSTPVMEKPVQVIQTALRSNSSLKNVTDQELYELLAYTVNTAARQKDAEGRTDPLSSPHFTMASREASVYITSTLANADVGLHMYDGEYVDFSNVNNPHLLTEAEKPKMQQANNSDDPPELLKVEEQLVPFIAKTKDAAPILDVDWIYFIDSGGQPQFHQLLPAFMHHTNLNVFVLRLCDKLSDHPTVEYYDGGTCIYSTPSLLTNKEILHRCAQATQTVDQDGVSKLLIVGTHRDLEDQCDGETRDDKNEKLLELLTPSMESHLMYFTGDGTELIYPLNVKDPSEDDRKVTNELCQAIRSMTDMLDPQKIPLRWLVFHQEIQALSKKTNVVVLSIQECSQVAIRLHMVDDTKAALQFFSDLNVILYYPSILPNVVFTNPQCILDVISEIVKLVAFDRKRHFNGMLVRANNEGIISEKLLEYLHIESQKVHSKGIIKPKDMISLMVHLGIASKCENGDEYFMPSLLKTLAPQGVQDIFSLCSDPIAPMALCHKKEESWKCKMVVCSKDELKAFHLSELGANAVLWLQENKQAEVDDDTPNLGDLMNDVAAVIPAKWRLVGVQLKLPNGTLDEIQAQNAGCILSFEQVIAKWRSLETSPYTWKTMINALCSPAVGEVKLANKLNAKMHEFEKVQDISVSCVESKYWHSHDIECHNG
eukprot:Em0008g688a